MVLLAEAEGSVCPIDFEIKPAMTSGDALPVAFTIAIRDIKTVPEVSMEMLGESCPWTGLLTLKEKE